MAQPGGVNFVPHEKTYISEIIKLLIGYFLLRPPTETLNLCLKGYYDLNPNLLIIFEFQSTL